MGMVGASFFSVSLFLTPFYILSAVVALIFEYPTTKWSRVYVAPLFLSAILPPIPYFWRAVCHLFRPMLEYFDYEEILEDTPVKVDTEILQGRNYLFVVQPHGAFSFCACCMYTNRPPALAGPLDFPGTVANAVLSTPILKHVMGMHYIVSASKASMKKVLSRRGARGCAILYVGGIAELFLSRDDVERVFLKSRKGFIKLALEQGVDVIPAYMFGNTQTLTVLQSESLAKLSRKIHCSIFYAWGMWGLPIPRPTKMMWVRGQPLGIERVEHPTQEEIDYWHDKYCKEVKRLFDTYKERVPAYKHKALEIV
jgi:2-acylglycerol O-acyltransferase 2